MKQNFPKPLKTIRNENTFESIDPYKNINSTERRRDVPTTRNERQNRNLKIDRLVLYSHLCVILLIYPYKLYLVL